MPDTNIINHNIPLPAQEIDTYIASIGLRTTIDSYETDQSIEYTRINLDEQAKYLAGINSAATYDSDATVRVPDESAVKGNWAWWAHAHNSNDIVGLSALVSGYQLEEERANDFGSITSSAYTYIGTNALKNAYDSTVPNSATVGSNNTRPWVRWDQDVEKNYNSAVTNPSYKAASVAYVDGAISAINVPQPSVVKLWAINTSVASEFANLSSSNTISFYTADNASDLSKYQYFIVEAAQLQPSGSNYLPYNTGGCDDTAILMNPVMTGTSNRCSSSLTHLSINRYSRQLFVEKNGNAFTFSAEPLYQNGSLITKQKMVSGIDIRRVLLPVNLYGVKLN